MNFEAIRQATIIMPKKATGAMTDAAIAGAPKATLITITIINTGIISKSRAMINTAIHKAYGSNLTDISRMISNFTESYPKTDHHRNGLASLAHRRFPRPTPERAFGA